MGTSPGDEDAQGTPVHGQLGGWGVPGGLGSTVPGSQHWPRTGPGGLLWKGRWGTDTVVTERGRGGTGISPAYAPGQVPTHL